MKTTEKIFSAFISLLVAGSLIAATPMKNLVLQGDLDAGNFTISNINSGFWTANRPGLISAISGGNGTLDLSGYTVSGVTATASWDAMGGTQSNVNISGFTNDAGFLTDVSGASVTYAASAGGGWPTSLSGFTNDAGYLTDVSGASVTYAASAGGGWPTSLSGFTNDMSLATFGDGSDLTNVAATSGWPTSLSGFTNDMGFLTEISTGSVLGYSWSSENDVTVQGAESLYLMSNGLMSNTYEGSVNTAGRAVCVGFGNTGFNGYVVGDGNAINSGIAVGYGNYGGGGDRPGVAVGLSCNATWGAVAVGKGVAAPGQGVVVGNGGQYILFDDGNANVNVSCTTFLVNDVAPIYSGGDGGGLTFSSAPDGATATGTVGQIANDGTYLYLCTATDTWVRAQISTLFSTW